MVSPDPSTQGSSMDEREKRFYNRPIPFRQPPSSSSSLSQSQSLSESDSSQDTSSLHKKRAPAWTPTIPSKPQSSSAKRLRNEEDESPNKKTINLKPIKEDMKNIKKPEPMPPSPQTSAKKPIRWNPKDEISFLKALAAYCQDGKEFPKNTMTPVYDYVRSLNLLDQEYSTSQLSEKFRRLRAKFVGMKDKVKGGSHSFKTAHDETLYKLSKKIWEKEEEGDESDSEEEESEKSEEWPVMKAEVGNVRNEDRVVKNAEVGNGRKEQRVVKKEEEVEKEEEENRSTGEDVEMTQKETDEVKEVDEDKTMATQHGVCNGTISNVVQDNNDKLIDQLCKENAVMKNEVKDQLNREFNELKSVIVKTVREGLHSVVNGETSNAIGFSSKKMMGKLHSARGLSNLSPLDVLEARMLEQKWERQELAELEVCSGHLALLQEECQKRIEKLRSRVTVREPFKDGMQI